MGDTNRKNPTYWADPSGCEQYPAYLLSGDGYDAPDDVWRWTENSGCPCWMAPAMMLYGHRYVLRADDDLLPGKRAVEMLLATAKGLRDEFSTIGQIGRVFAHLMAPDLTGLPRYVREDQPIPTKFSMAYSKGNAPRQIGLAPTKVDLTCRASFMRAEVAQWFVMFRNMLLNKSPERALHLVGVHDDFLLCMGTQYWSALPSYIIGQSGDPDYELIKTNLENGQESVWKRPNHFEERNEMVQLCYSVGWRSFV